MKKWKKYTQIIEQVFPRLTPATLCLIGEGDNNLAFLVNTKWIFRFPKNRIGKADLQKEVVLLELIRPLVNLRVPQFEFIPPDLSFVGYQKIPGTPLSSSIYFSLEKKEQLSVQQILAGFLRSLHSVSLADTSGRLLPLLNLREEYSVNFKDTQQSIFPQLNKSSKNLIIDLFTSYLNEKRNFTYKPVLIHNDLSRDHIFFDPSSKKLTGIIDFGDMALGDPDYDLLYLYDELGPEFITQLMAPLTPRGCKRILEKLRFFSLANKLQILLQEMNSNPEDARDAWQALLNWLKKTLVRSL